MSKIPKIHDNLFSIVHLLILWQAIKGQIYEYNCTISKVLPKMYCLKSKVEFLLSPNSCTIILLKQKIDLFFVVSMYSARHLIDWQYFSGSMDRIGSSISALSIFPSGKCLLNSSYSSLIFLEENLVLWQSSLQFLQNILNSHRRKSFFKYLDVFLNIDWDSSIRPSSCFGFAISVNLVKKWWSSTSSLPIIMILI